MKDRIDSLIEKYKNWVKQPIITSSIQKTCMNAFIADLEAMVEEDVKYELQTTWSISTGHVSPEFKEMLESGVPSIYGVSVYNKETYGWYVYDGEQDIPPEAPQALHDILTMARKLGVSMIEIDTDGPEVSELPKYQW